MRLRLHHGENQEGPAAGAVHLFPGRRKERTDMIVDEILQELRSGVAVGPETARQAADAIEMLLNMVEAMRQDRGA